MCEVNVVVYVVPFLKSDMLSQLANIWFVNDLTLESTIRRFSHIFCIANIKFGILTLVVPEIYISFKRPARIFRVIFDECWYRLLAGKFPMFLVNEQGSVQTMEQILHFKSCVINMALTFVSFPPHGRVGLSGMAGNHVSLTRLCSHILSNSWLIGFQIW